MIRGDEVLRHVVQLLHVHFVLVDFGVERLKGKARIIGPLETMAEGI